jgi:hypothetical protein
MDTHVRVLGVLNIVLGALGLLAALIILAIFGGIAGVVNATGDSDAATAVPILAVIGGALSILLLLVSAPGIIAGFGLLQHREWARILTIVLSTLNLLNIPFGTALGVYGLWVLLQPQTAALFQRPAIQHYGRV